MYDITKEQTFLSLKSWLDNLKSHAEQDICIMLVGNKVDLAQQNEDLREVPYEVAQQFANEESLMFIETSALSNNNVRDAFEILLQEIYNQRQKMPQSKPFNPLKLDGNTDPGQPTKSGCC